MPSDVIMPALGMAQDTGLIVSWLKQPGDAIKIGDALMEVETDKAVVEVEALADGFLTNVFADAGSQVPVGDVVAVISETVEAPTPVNSHDDANPAEELPEGTKIIMPALGMAQDEGLIVTWRKNAGDPIDAADILLEVKTDKSVVEVEAGHEGYVAAILAGVQTSVPVGSTIAIISADKPDNPISNALTLTAGQETEDDTEMALEPTPPLPITSSLQQPSNKPSATGIDGGQILASPKTRRLAQEQGLDLARLVDHGLAQPYHVSDLETLKTLRPNTALSASNLGFSAIQQNIEAWAPTARCDDFINWIATDGDIQLNPLYLWLSFATGAFRTVMGLEKDTLVVEIKQVGQENQRFVNADYTPVSSPKEADSGMSPVLLIRDFSGSAIVKSIASSVQLPVLTVGRHREDYVVSLDYHDGQFSEETAIEFITGFTERLDFPLRHLM